MFATAATQAATRLLRLPPVRTRRVIMRRDLRIRMRDGVPLLTDHFAPDVSDGAAVLIRTPYGRGPGVRLLGRIIAERGLHVLIQSCRGTFGSGGGAFEPLLHERDDGVDTVEWMRRQPWYGGRFGMFGASYQGFTQWALAPEVADDLAAMVVVCSASQTRDSTYAGDSFSLDTVLTWVELLGAEAEPWLARQVELKRGQPRLNAGLGHLPLAGADTIATGAEVPFFREWLRQAAPGAAYWDPRRFDTGVASVTAPVAMITGWYDIFLPLQVADYEALRAAGREPYLMIGPWTHGSVGLLGAAMRQGLAWLCAHLGAPDAEFPDDDHPTPGAVRIHVGGVGWRDVPGWPPSAVPADFHLHADGALATAPPTAAPPSVFRYDPRDPTPSLAGPLLVANRAGRADNRDLERRPDVLTFTGAVLDAPVEVVGPVEATVYVRGEPEYFDVFVRLCDVDARGRSWNISDGLVRVTPEKLPADGEGVTTVRVPMWPVAHRFAPGHRIRVQISGGAHPRYARNPGTGEPLATAVELRGGNRWIHHDPERPSSVRLPLVGGV